MTNKARPKVIVLTPVRDEAPILPRFLKAALLWADAVVIADQHSTDESIAIARTLPNVFVIENASSSYSEAARQAQLIAAARQLFPGPRFLVALDADELLTANALTSPSWRLAPHLAPGTGIWLGRVELCESQSEYFSEWHHDKGVRGIFAFADDGSAHDGTLIHSARLPGSMAARHIALKDVFVLHFARGNAAREKSKERWYQCYERLHRPDLSTEQIRHRYDWFERMQGNFNIRACPDEWFAGYRRAGVDLSEPPGATIFWTDWDILRMFETHGYDTFAGLDIWSFDWESLRQQGIAAGISGLPALPVPNMIASAHGS